MDSIHAVSLVHENDFATSGASMMDRENGE
jgi:hypothetical protein